MSQVRPGFLIALLTFTFFATYAFVAPATYRTSALVVVDSAGPAGSAASLNLLEPLEAARRLNEAILDRAMLEQLSRDRASSSQPEAQAKAASSVRASLAVDTSDAHSFSIAYTDNSPLRTQRVCSQLAHHAVLRAPQVLLDHSQEKAIDLRRQQQTQQLAAFLAEHPQVAAEPSVQAGVSPDKDPAISAFHAEKANLEALLSELARTASSDNPYRDPEEADPKLLRRRLVEIDAALNSRRDALAAKPTTQQLSPALRAEWKRLLDAVAQASLDAETRVPATLSARLVAEPPWPSAPIDPNRPLLLFFGGVFGIGLGTAFALVARATEQRRGKSSRPPKPISSQLALTVHLPSAPPLPSGFRSFSSPSSPSSPSSSPPLLLSAPTEPPIVPSPLRQISSAPPGPRQSFAKTLQMVRPQAATSEPVEETAELAKIEPVKIEPVKIEPVKIEPVKIEPVKTEPVKTEPVKTESHTTVQVDSSKRSADRASEAPNSPVVFASSLVLPPPGPSHTSAVASDPALASAARVWDDQIRAHDVPGFVVIGSRSDESLKAQSAGHGPSAKSEQRATGSAPVHGVPRNTSRLHGQMKVTQPLGSFVPDGSWADAPVGVAVGASSSSQQASASRTPIPARMKTPPPAGASYSSVSEPPAADTEMMFVRPVPSDWRSDSSLRPEARRAICEEFYPMATDSCFVVLVVGVPESQEQKSRVAAELALALSTSGHPRTLLLEADLQAPRVHRLLNVDMPMSAGFSQQLRSRESGSHDRRWTVVGCSKSLHVLAEGMMRSPGLLLSEQFSDSVRELRKYYDFIVIDGPSASLNAEASALDSVAEGVVFVCGKAGSPALLPMQSLFRDKKIKTVVTAP